jgi:MFS transporter, SHS family, lactate transporter
MMARATFPGFTYQFGNFLAAGNATLQVVLTNRLHGDYGTGMALVAGTGAVMLALLAALGPEAKEIRMTTG